MSAPAPARAHVHVFVYVARPNGAVVQKCACGTPSGNPPLMLAPAGRRERLRQEQLRVEAAAAAAKR